MNSILVILLITLAFNHVAHLSPVHSQEFNDNEIEDSNETSFTQDEFNESGADEYTVGLVEDEIKSRILKSLHKTEAPKSHVSLPPLQKLNLRKLLEQDRSLIETMNSTRTKNKTDLLPAEIDNACNDDNGIPCMKFHFNISLQDEFRSAELWLYKKENVVDFSITYIIRYNKVEENTTYVGNQTSLKTWARFDVSDIISTTNGSFSMEFIVAAEASEIAAFEMENDKKPFLLIHTVSDLRSVSKRSSYCSNDSSTCCRVKYYIKFRDIKWHNWIVHPEGYEANYCNGTCTVDLSNSHHARVFMALCENNPQKFKQIGKSECLACAPTAYTNISVIYLDVDGVRVVNHLPGMSVTDCGCV